LKFKYKSSDSKTDNIAFGYANSNYKTANKFGTLSESPKEIIKHDRLAKWQEETTN
jgi:hypothetical protein